MFYFENKIKLEMWYFSVYHILELNFKIVETKQGWCLKHQNRVCKIDGDGNIIFKNKKKF